MKQRKKSRKERIRPYRPVRSEYVEITNPFGDMPLEVRRSILREASEKGRSAFEAGYPKIAEWFSSYDALYLLSYCAVYFLSSPAGIDREAIDGKLDFASFHLELLQAFALTGPRHGASQFLGDRADELKTHLRDAGEALKASDFDFPSELSDSEFWKRIVIHQMRDQTFAVRHWVYPEQMLSSLITFFSGPASELIAEDYRGISIARLAQAMSRITKQIEDQLNDHVNQMRAIWSSRDFEETVTRFKAGFPGTRWTTEELRVTFDGICDGRLKHLKSILLAATDQWLEEIFLFDLEDVAAAYGEECPREKITQVLHAWSLEFNELNRANPMYFLTRTLCFSGQ
jgi:hypothetical protein